MNAQDALAAALRDESTVPTEYRGPVSAWAPQAARILAALTASGWTLAPVADATPGHVHDYGAVRIPCTRPDCQPAPDPLRDAEKGLIHAARDVDGAWDAEDHDGAPIQWYAEAGEVLADLRTAVIAHEKALGLYAAPARPDVECPHCDVRHEWPCPTIPRCDQQGCEDEATCGWPTPSGLAYRHTCGKHATGLGQRRPSRPDGEPR